MSFDRNKRGSLLQNLNVTMFPRTRRVSKAVSGGSKLSFSVLAFAGDGKGHVGFAIAKGSEVAVAQEKASRKAKDAVFRVPLREGRTVYHDVTYKRGATRVVIRSAPVGTGIVAGGVARMIAEIAGLRDVVIKCIGSTCPHNFAFAICQALKTIESPKEIAIRRGKTVKEILGKTSEQKNSHNKIVE